MTGCGSGDGLARGGQGAGTVAVSAWAQLLVECDVETKDLKLNLFFPSLPVGTIGTVLIHYGFPSKAVATSLRHMASRDHDTTFDRSTWRLSVSDC